jgi:hypothetical protein
MPQYEAHFKGISRRSDNKNLYLNSVFQLENTYHISLLALFTSRKPYVIMINGELVA